MKLKIKRQTLLKTLTLVADGIPAKTADPNFMNFLFTITKEVQTVLSSDGTITVIANLHSGKEEEDIIEMEEGFIEIPAKYLLDIVRQMEGEVICINQVEPSVVNINDGISNFNLNCVRGEEYPPLSLQSSEYSEFTVGGADFSNLIAATAFAVATKGPKRQFYGVKIGVDKGEVEFVATDSFRLARKTAKVSTNASFFFIAPVRALALVSKYSELKNIEIKVDRSIVHFTVDGIEVISSLYQGEFPSIERIIPTFTPYQLTTDSKTFINAVSRVNIVSSQKTQTVRLRCSEDSVEVFGKSDLVGNASEPVKNASFQGEPIELSFNYDFVVEAIKALNSPTVTFAFAGEGKAFLIKSDDVTNIQLVTPIRSFN